MGHYHYLVNFTKKEFVHPHQIGNGFKLREQVCWKYSTATALVMLLASSNGRGSGDFNDHPMVGKWAGDNVAFIGDFAKASDLKYDGKNAVCIFEEIDLDPLKHGWKNISAAVRNMMGHEFGISYYGDGWMSIQEK